MATKKVAKRPVVKKSGKKTFSNKDENIQEIVKLLNKNNSEVVKKALIYFGSSIDQMKYEEFYTRFLKNKTGQFFIKKMHKIIYSKNITTKINIYYDVFDRSVSLDEIELSDSLIIKFEKDKNKEFKNLFSDFEFYLKKNNALQFKDDLWNDLILLGYDK